MSTIHTRLRPDFEICRLAKGNWQIADDHSGLQFGQNEVNEHLLSYVDAGLDTFVCGDIYAGVEERLGKFREHCRQVRGDDVANNIKVLTTYAPHFLDEDRLKNHSMRDVERVIDRSLGRLRQERLDLVQMHWWNYDIPGFVQMGLWLQELQQKGKIHHIGATNFDTEHMRGYFDAGIDLIALTCQYSLLDSRPENGMVELLSQNNCHLICYGVVAGGLLSEKWLGVPDPGGPFLENVSLDKYYRIICDMGGWDLFQELLGVLNQIALKHRVSIASVASRFMLDRSQVAALSIGARDANHLRSNLQTLELSLDDADTARIQRILSERQGPAGDVYELDRRENRDALEEVKTEYFDVVDGELVKRTRDPVVLSGDAAYGHHLQHR